MKSLPDSLVPLIYLVTVAVIGGGLHFLGVQPELTGLIVGAGITRVKMPPPNGAK